MSNVFGQNGRVRIAYPYARPPSACNGSAIPSQGDAPSGVWIITMACAEKRFAVRTLHGLSTTRIYTHVSEDRMAGVVARL